MAVRNIVTLNNSDGFTAKQTAVLNRMLIAERDRWSKRSTQKINEPFISDALTSVSGIVSARQTQSFNGMVNIQFYLNDSLLKKDEEVEIISTKKNIKSWQLSGNMYNPGSEEGDISKFLLFRIDGNKVFVTAISDGNTFEPHIFLVNLTISME